MTFSLLNRWIRALVAFFYSPKGQIGRLPYILWFLSYFIIWIIVLSILYLFFLAGSVSLMCGIIENPLHAITEFSPSFGAFLQTFISNLLFFSVLLSPSVVFVPLKRLRSMGFSAWWLVLWLTPILGLLFGLLLCFWRPKKDSLENSSTDLVKNGVNV
ncbi:MAG: DUF805 domain-containing protein [Sulfuricurvum sp.]|nr:DUF805 domain-containing protein [Sulfuricurvum sp.]